MSRPIVTNALTHGLSLVGDLFVNQDDTILLQSIIGVITNLFSIQEMVQTFKHILSEAAPEGNRTKTRFA